VISTAVESRIKHCSCFTVVSGNLFIKQRNGASHNVRVQGGPKSKPLPNDQKIVINRIKTCEWDKIYSST